MICQDSRFRSGTPQRVLTMQVVYYESIMRELKTKPIYECRCDERLKTRVEESIDEMFVSEMSECVFLM